MGILKNKYNKIQLSILKNKYNKITWCCYVHFSLLRPRNTSGHKGSTFSMWLITFVCSFAKLAKDKIKNKQTNKQTKKPKNPAIVVLVTVFQCTFFKKLNCTQGIWYSCHVKQWHPCLKRLYHIVFWFRRHLLQICLEK